MCSPAAHCHPGFPATEVNGKLYWDGGCVSNTPLDAVVDEPGHPHMVVFLIDLWDAAGAPPQTINAVLWRAKQIQYASRTAHQVDAVATKVNLRRAVRLLKAAGVPDVAAVPDDARAAGGGLSRHARGTGGGAMAAAGEAGASRRAGCIGWGGGQ